MSTAHTPGPWAYTPGILKHYVDSPDGDVHIGLQEMHPIDGHDVPSAANARLISAAPELLAACKAVLAERDRFMSQFDPQPRDTPQIAACRAAIAKAEGRDGTP